MMIISAEDAKFLYSEGRINKFLIFNPTNEEIEILKQVFNQALQDFLIINVE